MVSLQAREGPYILETCTHIPKTCTYVPKISVFPETSTYRQEDPRVLPRSAR